MKVIFVYIALFAVIHFTGYHPNWVETCLFLAAVVINTLRERNRNEADYWRDMYIHANKRRREG